MRMSWCVVVQCCGSLVVLMATGCGPSNPVAEKPTSPTADGTAKPTASPSAMPVEARAMPQPTPAKPKSKPRVVAAPKPVEPEPPLIIRQSPLASLVAPTKPQSPALVKVPRLEATPGFRSGSVGFIDRGRKLYGTNSSGIRVFPIGTETKPGETAAELWSVEAKEPDSVDFSADGRWFAAALRTPWEAFEKGKTPKGVVKIWNAETRALHKTLAIDTPSAGEVRFSPDGKTLAIAPSHPAFQDEGKISLWDVAAGTAAGSLGEKSAAIATLNYSPDGTLLAYGDRRGDFGVWDLAKKQLRYGHKFATEVRSVTFSPDGKWLAASTGGAGDKGEIALYEAATGKLQPISNSLKEITGATAFARMPTSSPRFVSMPTAKRRFASGI